LGIYYKEGMHFSFIQFEIENTKVNFDVDYFKNKFYFIHKIP